MSLKEYRIELPASEALDSLIPEYEIPGLEDLAIPLDWVCPPNLPSTIKVRCFVNGKPQEDTESAPMPGGETPTPVRITCVPFSEVTNDHERAQRGSACEESSSLMTNPAASASTSSETLASQMPPRRLDAEPFTPHIEMGPPYGSPKDNRKRFATSSSTKNQVPKSYTVKRYNEEPMVFQASEMAGDKKPQVGDDQTSGASCIYVSHENKIENSGNMAGPSKVTLRNKKLQESGEKNVYSEQSGDNFSGKGTDGASNAVIEINRHENFAYHCNSTGTAMVKPLLPFADIVKNSVGVLTNEQMHRGGPLQVKPVLNDPSSVLSSRGSKDVCNIRSGNWISISGSICDSKNNSASDKSSSIFTIRSREIVSLVTSPSNSKTSLQRPDADQLSVHNVAIAGTSATSELTGYNSASLKNFQHSPSNSKTSLQRPDADQLSLHNVAIAGTSATSELSGYNSASLKNFQPSPSTSKTLRQHSDVAELSVHNVAIAGTSATSELTGYNSASLKNFQHSPSNSKTSLQRPDADQLSLHNVAIAGTSATSELSGYNSASLKNFQPSPSTSKTLRQHSDVAELSVHNVAIAGTSATSELTGYNSASLKNFQHSPSNSKTSLQRPDADQLSLHNVAIAGTSATSELSGYNSASLKNFQPSPSTSKTLRQHSDVAELSVHNVGTTSTSTASELSGYTSASLKALLPVGSSVKIVPISMRKPAGQKPLINQSGSQKQGAQLPKMFNSFSGISSDNHDTKKLTLQGTQVRYLGAIGKTTGSEIPSTTRVTAAEISTMRKNAYNHGGSDENRAVTLVGNSATSIVTSVHFRPSLSDSVSRNSSSPSVSRRSFGTSLAENDFGINTPDPLQAIGSSTQVLPSELNINPVASIRIPGKGPTGSQDIFSNLTGMEQGQGNVPSTSDGPLIISNSTQAEAVVTDGASSSTNEINNVALNMLQNDENLLPSLQDFLHSYSKS
ncbi:hypothetical protein SK128_024089, partial [Halocaridina rubra]